MIALTGTVCGGLAADEEGSTGVPAGGGGTRMSLARKSAAARPTVNRLEVAALAIRFFGAHVRKHGTYVMGTPGTTAHFTHEEWNHSFVLAENVLLIPEDDSLSHILDIWPADGRKSFSVSWKPERPWEPPCVSCFNRRAAWIPLLAILTSDGRTPT